MTRTALLLPVLLAVPAAAGDFTSDAAGTTGSEFLTIDAGARGIAMGGAYTAVANDATSLYWNPAGLSQVARMSAAYMYNRYVADIAFNYFAYAQRLNDTSVLGGAVRYMDGGTETNTDVNGLSVGQFRPRSYVYELGYGQYIADLADFEREISLGVTGRFLHSDMIARADGFAGDLGLQAHYYDAYYPHHFGIVFQNVGQGQKFDDVRDTLPFRARLGGSIQWNRHFLTSIEAVAPLSNQPYGVLGGEWTLEADRRLKTFLRAGFDSQQVSNGLESFRAATFGVGVQAGDFALDYALVPLGNLGDTHRFSVSFNLAPKGSRRYRQR